MKHITYSFSDSDIEAITTSLTLLPSYGFISNDISDMAFSLSASVGIKLISHESLSNHEASLIALSIDCAYKALRDEITIDEESVKKLQPYLFTINKLEPIFSSLLDFWLLCMKNSNLYFV